MEAVHSGVGQKPGIQPKPLRRGVYVTFWTRFLPPSLHAEAHFPGCHSSSWDSTQEDGTTSAAFLLWKGTGRLLEGTSYFFPVLKPPGVPGPPKPVLPAHHAACCDRGKADGRKQGP